MTPSGRKEIKDKMLDSESASPGYKNHHLIRVGAKEINFSKVSFEHTYFEHCYFRNCQFNSCDFTGCKFINCNFQGSSFGGSKFDYAFFEKTFIDSDILSSNCPSFNNLKLKFARALRMNYQSIGDAEAVNMAISIELQASKEHLYAAWNSNETYYRTKYEGWTRVRFFLKWLYFKIQHFVWGNGESWPKLLKTGIILWLICAVIDTFLLEDWENTLSYLKSFLTVPSYFMGIKRPEHYPDLYLTLLTTIRFVGFALFTSIIIKRFNRR
ncbi:pentapeptide repeat-containing protein [Dyadobacter luticola]|uniref:Pentapeptide repeat-containing protein n=1 Tax=Dyadobacter luticola TaxID=1979387 RepID=A0A5R9KVY5_9BACT|nr:pentapeptide repeat-containing protein [Dyadobacter luticola]TLV00404.1 pentapeptide repeat-containing protein [Dyadobacter luticola]